MAEERGADAAQLDAAVEAISRGELVVVPTDTVYGLAVDPANRPALERAYTLKRRPRGLEIGVLAADRAQLEPFALLGGVATRLADAFWPGPVSLIVAARAPRARLAVPRTGSTLSVRVPEHPLTRRLLRRTGVLAVTSANPHGLPPAVDAAEARAMLGDSVRVVVDGGRAEGSASTIVDCSVDPPTVLRHGAASEAVQAVLRGRG